MQAVMVVAHPDDCIIFGWAIFNKMKDWDWRIVYLTYTEDSPRGQEISKFWQEFSVPVSFCGVNDNYQDLATGRLSFDYDTASNELLSYLQPADVIVTHNSQGEYGHPHHIFVNNVLQNIGTQKIYFSSPDKSTNMITVPELPDLEKLPLHKNVIQMMPPVNTAWYQFEGDNTWDL